MATVTYIKETRQHPSAMVSVMRYCLQESKTVDQLTGQRYVSGIGCDGLNSITEFLATKYAYGKLDGINFYQYVQSFSPRENITYEKAHAIAREFAMKAWPGHEVQVTTHCDAKHIHSHFVINSVSFVDGRKLRQDPGTLKQLRAISDDLCREHGLSVLPPYEKGGKRMGSREYRIAAKGKSWKFHLMYDVTQAMKVSRNKEEFIREMERRGYEVKWTDERKNITFTCPNGMKCRDSRLHQEKYRKENIEHELYTRQCILAGTVPRSAREPEWTGHGGDGQNPVPADPLRSAGGMAESGQGSAPAGGRLPAYPVPDDPSAGNGGAGSPDAGRAAPAVPCGETGDAPLHPEFPATGWESEREAFFRNLRNPAKLDGIKAEARYVTVNEMFDLWCQLKRGLKNNTFENYKYMYDTFVRPNFGKQRIAALKKSDVKRFYNYLADERGLQASTIDSVHTVLHQVLNMAVDDDYIRSNPSDGVLKELKQSHVFKTEKRRGLTKPEQELLLNFLKNHPIYNHWYPIFAVMVGTGLRVGELAGLRWCDIDLEEGIIDINHTLVYYDHRDPASKQGYYFNVHTPKTEAGKRQVPMLGFVKEAFLMEREYQQLVGLECKVTIDGYTDFIFLNRDGGTFYQGSLNKTIRRIIRDCNDEVLQKGEDNPVLLPHFSCHSLRHTFTTRMCEAGVNIKVMQDTLGHADISTTLNIYADVTRELKKEEFAGLDSYFQDAKISQPA